MTPVQFNPHVILAAHAAGRLTAQMPGSERLPSYFEVYDEKVYRCAIGQLFSEDDARELQGRQTYLLADELVDRGLLTGIDAQEARELQLRHDLWAGEQSPEREQAFLTKLQEMIG